MNSPIVSDSMEIDCFSSDCIPLELQQLNCWHLWKNLPDQNGAPRKVPVDRNGIPSNHMDQSIHHNLPKVVSLCNAAPGTVGAAISLSKDGTKVLRDGASYNIACLDFDGFAEMNGLGLDDAAEPLLKLINSYTELSHSTTGFKVFFLTDKVPCTGFKIRFSPSKFRSQFPDVRKYEHREVEVFTQGRFLAVTGKPLFTNAFNDLRVITEAELNQLIEEINQVALNAGGTGLGKVTKTTKLASYSQPLSKDLVQTYSRLTRESLLFVLQHIDHFDEETWTEVNNAIARAYGDEGRVYVVEWGRGDYAQNPYPNFSEDEANSRFDRSLNELDTHPDGYGVKHLIYLARQNSSWPIDYKLEFEDETPISPLAHNALDSFPEKRPGSLEQLFGDELLRQEDVDAMDDAEIIYPDLIVKGHVEAVVSPANGGKTTIMIYVCEKLALEGMEVFYINVDGSPGDLKRHFIHAKKHGYKVLAPDARQGGSIQSIHKKLHSLSTGILPLNNTVLVFDTLKKFVQVIDKPKAAAFFKLTRALSVKGATVILLGHTNKHAGEDGQMVFEGTADLRNDVDELIYLDCYKNEAEGVLEVTTRPDKVRAELKPKTFIIDLKNGREVSELGYTKNIVAKEKRLILELFKDAINSGLHSQKDLLDFVEPKATEGRPKLRKLLIEFCSWDLPEIVGSPTGRGKDMHYALSCI